MSLNTFDKDFKYDICLNNKTLILTFRLFKKILYYGISLKVMSSLNTSEKSEKIIQGKRIMKYYKILIYFLTIFYNTAYLGKISYSNRIQTSRRMLLKLWSFQFVLNFGMIVQTYVFKCLFKRICPHLLLVDNANRRLFGPICQNEFSKYAGYLFSCVISLIRK